MFIPYTLLEGLSHGSAERKSTGIKFVELHKQGHTLPLLNAGWGARDFTPIPSQLSPQMKGYNNYSPTSSPQSFNTQNLPLSQKDGLRGLYRPSGFIIGHYRMVARVMVSPSPSLSFSNISWLSELGATQVDKETPQEGYRGSEDSLGSLKYTSRVNTPIPNQRAGELYCLSIERNIKRLTFYFPFHRSQDPFSS